MGTLTSNFFALAFATAMMDTLSDFVVDEGDEGKV
jgi:hypothetical protein